MQSSDLKIHKLKDLYQLRYKDKNIVCFHTYAKAGKYDKSETTVNVNLVRHGLRVGESVFLDYTSGTAVDETLNITSTTEDTFTCTSASSVTTAGKVIVRKEKIVEHPNKELLEFIKDDLFKCGEFSLNSKNQIEHARINSAYTLFSSLTCFQNTELYEGKTFQEFIKSYYMFDYILFDESDQNTEETNEARKIIEKMIKKELKNPTDLDELYEFNKGRLYLGDYKSFYYDEIEDMFYKVFQENEYILRDKNKIMEIINQEENNIDSEEKVKSSIKINSFNPLENFISKNYYSDKLLYKIKKARFLSEKEFTKHEITKRITKIYEDSTEFEKIAILTLFHYFRRYSFLLPLAFIRGGLKKKLFLNASLVIRGNHYNQKNRQLYKEFRYEIYQDANELATLCKNFALIGTKEQKEIWEKVQIGENVHLEFKETLSMDANKYREEDFDTVRNREQRKIIESNTYKAICALLNTKGGGEIYLGVRDKGVADKPEIVGIKKEVDFLFYKSNDNYLLYLKEFIKNNFSDQIKLISIRLFEVFKKEIIIIKVEKSIKPVFFIKKVDGKKEKIFYIRNGPSSDPLDIEAFYYYQFQQN